MNKLPWAILGTSLVLTGIIWIGFLYSESNIQNIKFDSEVQFMTDSVSDRLSQYEQVLVGAKGLFAASEKVEYDEWSDYVQIQNINERYPGIQGIGYIHHITNDERDELINEMKNYGVTDFTVHPDGIRDEYYPIIFLEPQDIRNKEAMGYDIYFQETRAEAVNTVKETGETTVTGKIILVQEIDDDIQNGFLMLVPVYTNGQPQTSDNLEGMVYAVFRMNDFVEGIFGLESFEYIHMEIYDNIISEDSLFFDSYDVVPHDVHDDVFFKKVTLAENNRDWIFVYEGMQPPHEGIEQLALFLIPIIGVAMSFLLFYVIRLFANFTAKQEQIDKLKEIEKQKTEFLSTIAHELKTPLTPITGWAEALTNPKIVGEITEKQKKAVNAIYSNAVKLNKLIGDLLDVQKLEIDRMEMNNTPFDVKELIETICQNFEHEFNKKNVKLQNNCNQRIVINGDAHRLEQVFNNMINNALDFIPNDTGIVELDAEQTGEFVMFSVKDNGVGISKENQKNLFKKFYQIDSSNIRKHGGTGLGLSICEGIIKKMGGQIWCESELGKGTIFYFTVPKDAGDKTS
ncbi:CHASE domain-containing protein [Nitrosopumilus sp. SJ]|uniref:CHASE domain-containing protein n=1 Tax=Nitrosopumilus sp. SJ TaxID=1027374 RepID=UPI001E4DF588|nr:CHASE domain-containing protein [Nitrosopumilus sp. SJ]